MKKYNLIWIIALILLVGSVYGIRGTSTNYDLRFDLSQLTLKNGTIGYSSNPSNIDENNKFRFGILGFDTIPPSLILTNPKNQSYFSSIIDLKFTTDSSKDTVWYNIDNGNNITIIENIQFSNSLGGHILRLYVNDSSNNINATSISYSIDSTSDTSGGGGGTGVIPVENISFKIILSSIWIKGQHENVTIIGDKLKEEDINISFYYTNIPFGGFQLINKTSLNETFIFNYYVPETISSGKYRAYINIKNKEELRLIDIKTREEAKSNLFLIISIISIILIILAVIGYILYKEEINEYVKKRKSKKESKPSPIHN